VNKLIYDLSEKNDTVLELERLNGLRPVEISSSETKKFLELSVKEKLKIYQEFKYNLDVSLNYLLIKYTLILSLVQQT
jgi:hypothetical protein